MDYNALVADLLALDPQDVQGMQRVVRLLSDLSDPSTLQLLDSIQDLEKIIMSINALDNVALSPPNPLTQRARYVNRVERLSACEGTSVHPQGAFTPDPYFKKLDIISCEFGGVGWEYDGPHYALVWEDIHTDSELTIIPTTSQFTKEFADEFSIGRIGGLPPRDTILSVKKMIRISRKRVMKHRTGKYVFGQLHTRLHVTVKERIENALAIWQLGEKPLDHYVRNEIGAALPVDFLTHYTNMRFIPVRDVRFDRPTLMLRFRKWNEVTTKNLQLKNPNAYVTGSYRKYMIYDPLFSNDKTKMAAAAAEFTKLY